MEKRTSNGSRKSFRSTPAQRADFLRWRSEGLSVEKAAGKVGFGRSWGYHMENRFLRRTTFDAAGAQGLEDAFDLLIAVEKNDYRTAGLILDRYQSQEATVAFVQTLVRVGVTLARDGCSFYRTLAERDGEPKAEDFDAERYLVLCLTVMEQDEKEAPGA